MGAVADAERSLASPCCPRRSLAAPLARAQLSSTVTKRPSWSAIVAEVGCTLDILWMRFGCRFDVGWRALGCRLDTAPWCRQFACFWRGGEPAAPRSQE